MGVRFFITLVLIKLVLSINAQTISVASFKLLESDLTANTAGTMEQDQNGEVAALIKVVTTQTGFTFDGGTLGIVKTKQTPGEIWVYVPRGSKKITIKHPQLGVLRDYFYPQTIEPARTYEMTLITGSVQTIVKPARNSQYVVFRLTPPNAIVELDGNLLQTVDGTATKLMKLGSYDYRIQAPDYFPEVGKVNVNNPDNKVVVDVKLKPNFASVVVNVENDAEIWINGEKKGNGKWNGNLGEGTYDFEAKKQGHRSTFASKDIIVTSEPQIIILQTPTPIYGGADINSNPAMADIYIDGEKKGQTPQIIPNLLVGSHQLRIVKEGYEEANTTMTIKENETISELVNLKEKNSTSVSSSQISEMALAAYERAIEKNKSDKNMKKRKAKEDYQQVVDLLSFKEDIKPEEETMLKYGLHYLMLCAYLDKDLFTAKKFAKKILLIDPHYKIALEVLNLE